MSEERIKELEKIFTPEQMARYHTLKTDWNGHDPDGDTVAGFYWVGDTQVAFGVEDREWVYSVYKFLEEPATSLTMYHFDSKSGEEPHDQ